MIKKLKKEDGFTLIEMTVVLVVIALLLIVFLPNITDVNDNVSKTTNKALEQTVDAQMILYKAQYGADDASVDKLKEMGFITQEQYDAYDELNNN